MKLCASRGFDADATRLGYRVTSGQNGESTLLQRDYRDANVRASPHAAAFVLETVGFLPSVYEAVYELPKSPQGSRPSTMCVHARYCRCTLSSVGRLSPVISVGTCLSGREEVSRDRYYTRELRIALHRRVVDLSPPYGVKCRGSNEIENRFYSSP